MTITTTKLTRAAGIAAAVAGLLFIGVQIRHPHVDLGFATTTEWKVREGVKVLFAALSLAGITGMYTRQVKQTGVLGLLGYVLFSVGCLAMMCVEVVGAVVVPSIAHSSPGYVSDVLAVAIGGHATGDIGLMNALISTMAIGFLGGGVVFGIALFRADVLARWASGLLAVAAVATASRAVLPHLNERLFAIPTGIALVGLGWSLWREQRTAIALPLPIVVSPGLEPVGAK